MKKSGILLGILIVIGSITEAAAQCWIDKKDGYNYKTIGKARPNGGGIDITWIDKKDGYNYPTVGKVRPNGGGIDIFWIDKKDGYNYPTVGKARPNGGGINITWIDKKEGYNYVTVGKIRPNSNEDCYTREVIAVAGYLLLLDETTTN